MTAHGSVRGHTQRQLRELFAQRGLRARSSLGQCFLVDLNLLDVLIEHAELSADDFVLEVGSGTGSLTRRLAERAGSVLSVEIDRGLYELASESVAGCPNVRLLCADILKNKNALNPAVLAAISELAPPGRPIPRKLVANLPFSVATPVISLVLLLDPPWDRFVVTLQKELADRLIASPGTKDYGSLSVLAQALADVRVLRQLPPTAFWPRPKVSSAIVWIEPRPAKRAAVSDLGRFSRLARGVMLHRRKNLRGALSGFLGLEKTRIDHWLLGLSLDPQCRAESLPVEHFVRMANELPADWQVERRR